MLLQDVSVQLKILVLNVSLLILLYMNLVLVIKYVCMEITKKEKITCAKKLLVLGLTSLLQPNMIIVLMLVTTLTTLLL